jgi:hypothetical protein
MKCPTCKKEMPVKKYMDDDEENAFNPWFYVFSCCGWSKSATQEDYDQQRNKRRLKALTGGNNDS